MDWITGMEYWTGMTLDLIENKISKNLYATKFKLQKLFYKKKIENKIKQQKELHF